MSLSKSAKSVSGIQSCLSGIRNLAESIPQKVFVKDLNLNFVFINSNFARDLNISPEEITGKMDSDFFPPDLVEKYRLDDQRIIEKGETEELEERYRENGVIKWVRTTKSPFKDHDGRIIGVVGIFQDISESKQAQQALRASEERYRSLLTNLDAGVVLHDPDTSIRFSNYRASQLLGLSEDQMKGKLAIDPRWNFIHESSVPFRLDEYPVNRIVSSRKALKNLILGVIRPETNHVAWLSVNGVPILSGTGEIDEIVISFIDITEQKEAEILLQEKSEEITQQNEAYQQINEELIQSNEELLNARDLAEESERLKSAFLANMSHEIRTPMNGILGFTELLKEQDLTAEEQQKYISIIETSGDRLLNIINNIISISKIESGKREITLSDSDLNIQLDFIHSFFQPEAKKKGLQLNIQKFLPVNESVFRTDKEKVYAVMTNLLKNAIKFTQSGLIEFGLGRKGEFLEFFVRDTGTGIRPEQKTFIFERFRQGSESTTRNFEGAGLGLAISKAYVEMLGGKMWVESEFGQGSTFYFTLPADTNN